MIKKKEFSRSICELERIFSFLKECFNKFDIPEHLQFEFELTIEEIFTNMVRHNLNADSNIEIKIQKKNSEIISQLSDHEKIPFDITKVAELDVEKHIDEKKAGGLGIFMVKKMMDKINFEHKNGISTITITKILTD